MGHQARTLERAAGAYRGTGLPHAGAGAGLPRTRHLPGPTVGWMNVMAVASFWLGKQYASIWRAASKRRAALVPAQNKCRHMHAPT